VKPPESDVSRLLHYSDQLAVALQLADSLIILLLLATLLFAITYFYFTGRQPAIAYVLATYTPFQNVILPLILASTVLPAAAGIALITLKDSLLLCGLLFCLVHVSRISIQRVDILGLLFIAFLFSNLILSDSGAGPSLRAFRSFSVPVLLYFFGRLSLQSNQQIQSFVKWSLGLSVIVMIVASIDYVFVVALHESMLPSPQDQLSDFYGHIGSQETYIYSKGFLGSVPKLVGPFGNNLITAAYLRAIICIFIFYLVQSKKTLRFAQFIFLTALFAVSALTLSRFTIGALYLIGFLLVIQDRLWSVTGKVLTVASVVFATALAWNILAEVATTTLNVEDESTHGHVSSIVVLGEMELTVFGHGLGFDADTGGLTRALKGEGYIRQFMPELGIFGIALFLSFAASVVLALVRFRDLSISNIRNLPGRFWIALPLIIEILHTPIDTGIQSFLANGLVWFLVGAVISAERLAVQPGGENSRDVVPV